MRLPLDGAYVLSLRLHPEIQKGWFEAAVLAARRLDDRPGEGAALGNLGNAYAALGEPRRAIDLYEQQLTIAREIGDRRGEGTALYNLAFCLAGLNELPAAIAAAEAAIPILESLEDPDADTLRTAIERWRGEAEGNSPPPSA